MPIEILPKPEPSTATGNTPEDVVRRDRQNAKILGKYPTDDPQLIEIGKHVKHGLASSARGKAAQLRSVKVRRDDAQQRNSEIVSKAQTLMRSGKSRREIPGILATRSQLSRGQVNRILLKHGI